MAAASAGDSFVHLHVHTEYSMLDGAARLKDLFDECGRMEMPAIAITDHGNVYGAYDFCPEGRRRPGSSRSSAPRPTSRPSTAGYKQPVRWGTPAQKDDDVSGGGAYTHMTLLAETTEGMHNLFKLSSRASLEGYFRKPRMDRELLSEYARGLIAHHRLPGGEVQTRLRLGQYDAGARRRRRLPRHLRRGQFLRRAHGPRPGARAAGQRRAAADRPRA